MVVYYPLSIVIPVIGAFGILIINKINKKAIEYFSLAIVIITSIISFLGTLHFKGEEFEIPWFYGGFLVSPVSIAFSSIVAIISIPVMLFSIKYLKEGPKERYYFFMLLFISSSYGLAFTNNFLGLYLFWELMGLCSCFLIAYHFKKKSAVRGGIKAFILTRIGDICLLLGIILLFLNLGTFNISQTISSFQKIPYQTLTLIAFLFGIGAIAKSAQIPFHTWLPDAMDAPSPASALIHGATIVNAGIFLLVRTFLIFYSVKTFLITISLIGAFTAFLCGIHAIFANNAKKILAYSTSSQIGYIFAAIGIGALNEGILHTINHSIFKALLFICAGIAIYSTKERIIHSMKLSKRNILFISFLIGVFAISGLPLTNAFWSKEALLTKALSGNHYIIFSILAITNWITSIYSFRMLFSIFDGNRRVVKSKYFILPILMLSSFCIAGGIVNFEKVDPLVLSVSLLSVSAGAVPTYFHYQRKIKIKKRYLGKFLETIFKERKYFDELYRESILFLRLEEKVIEILSKEISKEVWNITKRVILIPEEIEKHVFERANRYVISGTRKLSNLSLNIENSFDFLNIQTANFFKLASQQSKKLQTGFLNTNILFILIGFLSILIFTLITKLL